MSLKLQLDGFEFDFISGSYYPNDDYTEEDWIAYNKNIITERYKSYCTAQSMLIRFCIEVSTNSIVNGDSHDVTESVKKPLIDAMEKLRTTMKYFLLDYISVVDNDWIQDVYDIDFNYSGGLDVFKLDKNGECIGTFNINFL